VHCRLLAGDTEELLQEEPPKSSNERTRVKGQITKHQQQDRWKTDPDCAGHCLWSGSRRQDHWSLRVETELGALRHACRSAPQDRKRRENTHFHACFPPPPPLPPTWKRRSVTRRSFLVEEAASGRAKAVEREGAEEKKGPEETGEGGKGGKHPN